MSPYLVAFIIPVNITKQVAPLLEMPPHMYRSWVGACGGISASSEHFSGERTSCGDTPAALCINQ